jgi:hypothetical protein
MYAIVLTGIEAAAGEVDEADEGRLGRVQEVEATEGQGTGPADAEGQEETVRDRQVTATERTAAVGPEA